MSLTGHHSFFSQLNLYSRMYKDNFGSIMELPKEDIEKRIALAQEVLKNSSTAYGILDGKLSAKDYKTIEIYIEMLKLVKDNDTEYVPEPVDNIGAFSGVYKSRNKK